MGASNGKDWKIRWALSLYSFRIWGKLPVLWTQDQGSLYNSGMEYLE